MSLAASNSRPAAACAARPGLVGATAALRAPRVQLAVPARHCRRQQRLAVLAAASSSSAAAAPAGVAADLDVLRQACKAKDVPPEEVLAAIGRVEAAHKQQSLVQGFPAALAGTWRLVFSSPAPIKAWQYIPVLEDAIIDVDAGTIDLASVVGPLDNVYKGTCTFKSDPASGKYAMNFGFSASESVWFGRWQSRKEFATKSRVYSFFLLTDDLAVANSSGGPKTLMYRVK
ncbi:hypothetical protein ABPG75_005831 [Micractinium tetrahymenae]